MLTLLFIICMFGVFGKLFFFGLKAAWGISAIDPACNGSRRTDLPGIADTSCYWYCRTDRIKSIRK